MKSVPKSRIACNSALLWFFGISSTIFTNSFVTVKKETTKKLFTEFSFKYTSQVLKFFFFILQEFRARGLSPIIIFYYSVFHGCVLTVYSPRLHHSGQKVKPNSCSRWLDSFFVGLEARHGLQLLPVGFCLLFLLE